MHRPVEQAVEGESLSAVVLVEGISDRLALEALGERRGRDLAAEGISVIAMGGAPQWVQGHIACGAGLGANLTRADLEQLGFYVCSADREDELIRALGVERVLQVVQTEGDLRAFRTLQTEPAWRGRPVEAQLHRFMGSGGSRKIRYPPLLVHALGDREIPRPLAQLLAHI